MKWISIKDQLPPFDQTVLIKNKENKINIGKLRMMWEISEGYVFGITEPEMKNSGVFWMPIPEEISNE